MIEPEGYLLLPRLRVQNTNAISGALTWGFPSPSAFTGFVHALHRRVTRDLNVALEGVAIVCHHFEAQASCPAGKRTRVFHLTRNPLDKGGGTAAIVEEGRAHLVVSLVIGVSGDGLYAGMPPPELAAAIQGVAEGLRLAGGSILPRTVAPAKNEEPLLELRSGASEADHAVSRRLTHRLLPGFALVSREQLLHDRWQELQQKEPGATELDALLDLSSLNVEPPGVDSHPDGGDDARAGAAIGTVGAREWTVRRKPGWLVPLPAGYRALSDLYDPGSVKNARDQNTPFRFVEGLYTIGQWLSPHRVDDVRKLLWVHQFDSHLGLYRWTTPHFASVSATGGL